MKNNILKFKLNKLFLTVCKSRRNRINVIKPDRITNGVKLNNASSFPNKFPKI